MTKRIRLLVDKGRRFTPPPGTRVIAGSEFRELSEFVLLVPNQTLGESLDELESSPDAHHVRCPSCGQLFELFAASWCGHRRPRPSKLCPHCERCACADPDYTDDRFWREAPPVFHRHGIREIFVRYL